MALVPATLLVSFLTVLAWAAGLKGHAPGSYVTLSLFGIHFFLPLVLAYQGDPLAARYSSNSTLALSLTVAYLVVLFGFTRLGRRRLRQGTAIVPQRIDGTRLSSRTSLLISSLWTGYLVIRLGIDVSTFSAAGSRATTLLNLRANSATDGTLEFLVIAGSALAYFALFSLFTSRGRMRRVAVWLFASWFLLQFASLLLVSLHRSPLVFLVVAHLLIVHFYIAKVPMARLLVVAGVLALPIIMSVLADIRSNQAEVIETRTIQEQVIHGSSGLATSLEFYRLVEATQEGQLDLEYGEQLALTSISWVPRILWEDKPIVSFSFRKTIEVHGPIGPRNWVRTFTAWGEGYSQFGYVGIPLYSILIVAIVSVLLAMWRRVPGMAYAYVHLLVSLPLLLRGDLHALVSRALPIIGITAAIAHLSSVSRGAGSRARSSAHERSLLPSRGGSS